MIIVTEKPVRSIELIGYGVSKYTDKNGKVIHKVYGIIYPAMRGRIVPRMEEGKSVDPHAIKDMYFDEQEITLFRSKNEDEANLFKKFLDVANAQGVNIVSVSDFANFKAGYEKYVNDTAKAGYVYETKVKEEEDK